MWRSTSCWGEGPSSGRGGTSVLVYMSQQVFVAKGEVFGATHYLCEKEVMPGFFLRATPDLAGAMQFSSQAEVDAYANSHPDIRKISWVLTPAEAAQP